MKELEDKLREDNLVTIEESWEDVKSKCECFNDDNAKYLSILSDRSQRSVYEMIQKELIDLKEEERKAKEAVERSLRRQERENFRQLLDELVNKNKIHGKSIFEDIEILMKDDERYKILIENQKDRVNDLFDAYMSLLRDQLYDDKKILKTFFKNNPLEVTPDDNLETILKKYEIMDKNEAMSKINNKHRDLLLLEVC